MAGIPRVGCAFQSKAEQGGHAKRSQVIACLAGFSLLLLVALGAASASADGSDSHGALPTSAEIIHAIETEAPGSIEIQPTDLSAAEELPHQNLDRAGALELLQGVFETPLEAPAGIFSELEVEKFLAPNVALVQAPSPEGGEGTTEDGELADAILLESTIPLRTESSSGDAGTVDLSLEHVDGEIQPANALVEVGLPAELGDGIELPGADLTIELVGAPANRVTSIVDQSIGFLPNVALDTDLAIAPTPTGVETFTHLRSADAPRSQSFNLDLPPAATLHAIEGGGAVVRSGEEILVSISPPTAIDATGSDIPVDLDVEGSSITLDVAVDQQTSFPVLVDPLYQTYDWAKSNHWQSGICNSSFEVTTFNNCNVREEWGYEHVENPAHNNIRLDNRAYGFFSPVPQGTPGLFIETSHDLHSGDRGAMNYTVPRYFTDQTNYGSRPTSFISNMTLWNLDWNAHSSSMSPYIFAGIWDSINGWVSYYSHEGLVGHGVGDMAWKYQFNNASSNVNAKVGAVSVQATQTGPNQNTEAYVGSASIALADKDLPVLGPLSNPSGWVDQSALPASIAAGDSGLGVHSLVATSQPYSWKTSMGCIGVSGSPCPRNWASSEVGSPPLKYDPSVMPQGLNKLSVVAEDPVGNKSVPANIQIKIDHSAPKLALSGSATEQTTLGTNASQYILKYSATDGDNAAPEALAPFGSAGTAPGQMQEPRGIAADANGNLWVVDRGNDRVMKFDSSGNFKMQFGSTGSGNGQFSDPRGIAISENGTIWVTDMGSDSVQAFNESGQFIQKLPVVVELVDPYGVATGPGGAVWVSDITADKLLKFNESGALLLTAYGSASNPTGPTDLKSATGLATDVNGNVWLADYVNNRVQKFDSNGKYLLQFGSTGSGSGQLENPLGIAIAPSGHIFVSEEKNNRVSVFQANGTYLRQFGSAGSGNAGLSAPKGIALGAGNTAFVVDPGNNRVVRWTHADLDRQSGVASTEVKVDGNLVEPKYAPGCATENCPITKEWTLLSKDYESGPHNVQVTATDGVGLSTTKSLAITTVKDTTGPKLTGVSPYFLMPKGWMEQKTYSYSATMSDSGGYGVTSFVFKIDGQVVKSTTQSCPNGACQASISGSIDMATYDGGAHPAEFVVTDAAGNTTKVARTFNVDPKGDISVGEVKATLEALDDTSGASTVAPESEFLPVPIEGYEPSLVQGENGIESQGTSNPMTVSADPASGFEVDLPTSLMQAEPIDPDVSATPMTLVEETTAISGNTAASVDTVIRPLFDGLMMFKNIRDKTSPEVYEWRVGLDDEQTLKSVNNQTAEVAFDDGSTVYLITAIEAHDAVGTAVSTSLAVSENILKLTVSHNASSYIYPVIAGSGWEGGFLTEIVTGPKDEQEIKEELELKLIEEHEAVEAMSGFGEATEVYVSPPEPATASEAEVTPLAKWNDRIQHRQFRWIQCKRRGGFGPGSIKKREPGGACGNPFTQDPGESDVVFNYGLRGDYYIVRDEWVKHKGSQTDHIECDKMLIEEHIDQGLIHWDYFMDPARQCKWYGKTKDSEPFFAEWGEHLTPFGEWLWGVGSTGNWTHHQAGLALYIWVTDHVGHHNTTCIDC